MATILALLPETTNLLEVPLPRADKSRDIFLGILARIPKESGREKGSDPERERGRVAARVGRKLGKQAESESWRCGLAVDDAR
jgi:hypothetical protein